MSTIIECPACSTRYKMNKDIPEGGRNVKCARCGNQWRLTPEGYVEQTIELDEVEHNPVASQEHETPVSRPEAIAALQPEAPIAVPQAPFPSRQTRREQFSGATSTMSEPQVAAYAPPAAAMEAARSSRRDAAPDETAEPSAGFAVPERNAEPAVTWSFRDSVQGPADDDANEAEDAPGAHDETAPEQQASASWTGRINRPWREIVEASRASTAEDEQQDTEVAIREALKAALEHPIEDGSRAGLFQQQLRARPEDPPAEEESAWSSFAHADAATHGTAEAASDEDLAETEMGEEPDVDEDDARNAFTIPGHDPVDESEDDESEVDEHRAPFRLTGLSARLPVYEAEDTDEALEAETGENVNADGDSFRNDIEDAFRAAPLLKRPFEPASQRAEAPLTDFDNIFDEHEAGGEAGAAFYDEKAAADLQAELESTDLTSYETPRARGGLAVAAAWAVFFSVVSGVALAAVTLRSEIMAALPGTTSLYRAIGFDVAETGIDFADVSYRWTVAQGKPMIEVKGQVVNITDRRLTVPRVLINVHDASSSDAVKVTASVPTESLAPRESASFTLEFVSPPKNISQIELEFDRNR